MEEATRKELGSSKNPLLVSVRSGAPVSMPGMMDTILNLGLNDEVADAMTRITNNKRFVYDSYRRLIMMFADVVMGYDRDLFDNELDNLKKEKNVKSDTELTDEDMYNLTVKL